MKWPQVIITTNHTTKEETIEYSETPEAFVERLRACGETVIVTNRACAECFYTPDRSIPEHVKDEYEKNIAPLHIAECICITASRQKMRAVVPDFVICYAVYYLHCQENPYLKAATEAGLVTFYDITGLPGLRETGLLLMKPTWDYGA